MRSVDARDREDDVAGLTARFPSDWRCTITVRRGGGRNADGDPVPGSEHTIPDCLVGSRSTKEPVDRSDLTESTAVAFAPPRADVVSTDTITVPAGHFMAGEYVVDGDPGFWPLGTEIPLRRA